MWTYLLGPLLSLLPLRWRELAGARWPVRWIPATIISGAAESFVALIALVGWYSYSVTHWAQQVLFSTAAAHPEASVPENTIGFAALALLALHPFTWLIAWFGVEGVVRFLGAAFTGHILGSFPLYLLDRLVIFWAQRSKQHKQSEFIENARNSVADGSFAKTLAKALASEPVRIPDEIIISMDGIDEILEIHSVKTKENWEPPKVVRYGAAYYRLEFSAKEDSPRPFRFFLRRLSVGVPGPLVLQYSPDPAPIIRDETGLPKNVP